MEIKKHGKFVDTKIDFRCSNCGCEFEMPPFESESAVMYAGETLETQFRAHCPECGAMCMSGVPGMGEMPDKKKERCCKQEKVTDEMFGESWKQLMRMVFGSDL